MNDSSNNQENTILVVDDNIANVKALQSQLKNRGYHVLGEGDGLGAINAVKQHTVDLILLDVMMPGMSGFEVCKQLKKSEDTKEIPVIFMTAMNDTEYKLQGFEAGGVDYIIKPPETKELIARLKTHLKIRHQQKELQDKNEELENAHEALNKAHNKLALAAKTDALTGLFNRAHVFETFEAELEKCISEHGELSVCMMDVDYFKAFNDIYGHQEGDRVLELVAQCIRNSFRRSSDLVGRYGGEEFIAVIPFTPHDQALRIAEELRQKVINLNIDHKGSRTLGKLSLSIGIINSKPNASSSVNELIKLADEALYRAKDEGRNRIVSESC